MRIPFPTQVSLSKATLFAGVLFGVEMFQKTNFFFALLVFAYIVIGVVTFNVAKGFTKPTGVYVFAYVVLTVVLGVIWKAVLGEAADTNLRAPLLTMSAYVVSISTMLLAVLVSRSLLAGRLSLADRLTPANMDLSSASTGCFLGAVIIILLGLFGFGGSGTIVGALSQINVLFPLSIILGTLHAIRSSNGRRSFTPTTALAFSLGTFLGFTFFSKQGFFIPLASYLITVAAYRYKFRVYQVVIGAAYLLVSFAFLVPIIQIGKNGFPERTTTYADCISLAFFLITNPEFVRGDANSAADADTAYISGYYSTPQGFIERLTMMPIDDQLIAYTDASPDHAFGLGPIKFAFENWVPHFLAPHKELDAVGGGNFYAHEMGAGIGEDDHSTGISFSATAEGFHLATWFGLIFVAPAVWLLLFTVVDFICGAVSRAPWGLLAGVAYLHVAPESMLSYTIQFIWTGSLGIIVAMLFCGRLAPILGALLGGGTKSSASAVQAFHRPLRSFASQNNI